MRTISINYRHEANCSCSLITNFTLPISISNLNSYQSFFVTASWDYMLCVIILLCVEISAASNSAGRDARETIAHPRGFGPEHVPSLINETLNLYVKS